MHFTVDVTHEPPHDWNDFLLKSETGTIQNTSEYSEYALKWLDWKPLFLRLTDSTGNIVLQNLLFESNRPLTKIPAPIRNICQRFYKVLRWNYGPITTSQDSLVSFFQYLTQTKRQIYGTTHPFTNLPEINFRKQKWTTFLMR